MIVTDNLVDVNDYTNIIAGNIILHVKVTTKLFKYNLID